MQLQQWILFFSGLVILFLGACLMAYGSVAKRAFAGKEEKPSSTLAQIILAFAELLKVVGDYIGANAASKIGFLLMVAGFVLVYFSLQLA